MITLTRRRWLARCGLLSGLLLVSAAIGIAFGSRAGSLAGWLRGDPVSTFIVLDLRLPRVLAAIFVGGALGACGAAFQGLLRNPLASPFVLGVSGGGSLGAVAAILLGLDAVVVAGVTISTRPAFAFLGCLAALLFIWAVARRRGHLVPQVLLLAGVVANVFFLSLLGFLNYLASPHQASEILRWLMGGLYGPDLPEVLVTGALSIAGTAWLTARGRDLNALTLGGETAHRLGVDVARTRRGVFVVASLLTGAAVAVAGPIAFVGLFTPHAVRLLFGPDHRFLVPASFLAGGAFLALSDTLARVVSGAAEMPVGLVTAAVGAPCFILILVRARGAGGGEA